MTDSNGRRAQRCRALNVGYGNGVSFKTLRALRRFMKKVAEPCDPATSAPALFFVLPYGATHMVFRDGANPTGITVVSFIVAISTTETLFVSGLAT
jgi:hypothetical protein